MKPIIFLLKNEPVDNSSVKSIIERDFEVVEVNLCNSIYSRFENLIPDIIIIDEPITDSKAYEVCQQIKFSEKYHFIPVVFTGPQFCRDSKVRLIESGADDYFEEPFDTTTMVAYLNAFLEKRENFPCLMDKHSKLKKETSQDKNVLSRHSERDEKFLFGINFEQFAVGIVQVGVDGYFQKVNDRFCNIVGYNRDELKSLRFRKLTYHADASRENILISRVLSGEINSYEIEKRYVHKDGHLVWVKVYSSVVRDDSDKVRYAAGIVADISKQKKAESLIHESEALFRTMYESSGIGIVQMSVNDKIIEQANDAFCSMLGYTEDELIGKSLREISYYEDLPANIDQQNRLVAGELNTIQMEKRYLHKDGHLVWALLRANLIFDEHGTPLYYVGNVLDISEMKKSQSLLKESEEKYRTYVDNSPYPIFAADFKGNYVDVNPAACAITGYSREELTNMKITDICAPESWDLAAENIRKLFDGEKPADEYLFIKKDGTRFYMLVASVLINEAILGICVDTTERKKTEKLLIEAKMLAEDASKSKTEFVSNISHELRTPLNIVIGYSDVLLSEMSGELNEKQRKYANSVKDAGSNLLEIVNSLIYIAEIEAGDWEINISKFDLPSIIEYMDKIIRTPASKKGISLVFEIGKNIDGVYADVSKFKIILHHLIGNSIKFTHENGSIKVVIDRNGHELYVLVTDTGIGIPDEEQEQLFDPFVQLNWSHARKYGGVGIGLALVKELIEMHGGSIGLESKVGEGTRIWFTIPQ